MFKISSEQKSILISELEFKYVRSSGPGGQNVNKVSSAVLLRWNVADSKAFSEEMRGRLLLKLTLTKDNDFLVSADSYRDQKMNRDEAIVRLVTSIEKALYKPKKRISTQPTRSSKRRRVDDKKKRGKIKSLRRGSYDE